MFYNKEVVVKYFCEIMKINLRSTLTMPKGGDHALLFALAVGLVKNENIDIFKYLWEMYDYVWEFKSLKQALLMIIEYNRIDQMQFILRSKTTHSLFLSFSYHFRIQFLSQFVENYLSSNDTEEN
jgi:hypothetical protein